MDQEFVNRVKETTLSEVSIVNLEQVPGSENLDLEVIVSTLTTADQFVLAEQMRFDDTQLASLQRISAVSQDYTSLLCRLYGVAGGPLQVFAVI